ncbi:RICIN domain-containing protein [Runella sp.]|uniref:RICIN domain-containing protein n=1 Tax=Runella sp. TaxID=1960881 RepID=UPI003D0CC8A0
MKQTIFALLIIVNALVIKAQEIKGTFAVQNVATQKNLRPYEAQKAEGNRIVLYDHREWKCMTWDFQHKTDNVYQLKNLFTAKTFQTETQPKAGDKLIQKTLINDDLQQEWEFIKEAENQYSIRLKNTNLYVTAADSNGADNSAIILQEKQKSDLQRWKLVAQTPSF